MWTDERIEELQRRWSEGESAAVIAAALMTSRNAVLGKIHRIGLSQPKAWIDPDARERTRQATVARNAENKRAARRKLQGSRKQEVRMQELPSPAPVFAGSLNIPFADLREYRHDGANQCRYIADDPAAPDYIACGNETLPGKSWCSHCKGIVYGKSTLTHEERAIIAFKGRRDYLDELRVVR